MNGQVAGVIRVSVPCRHPPIGFHTGTRRRPVALHAILLPTGRSVVIYQGRTGGLPAMLWRPRREVDGRSGGAFRGELA